MNRKGFTLIELIATIVLLGIIASISFVSINAVINKNKNNNCKTLINNIKTAANEYVSDNRYKNISKELVIYASTLTEGKYLSSPINNPYSNGEISPNDIQITIELNDNYNIKKITISNNVLNKCQ